MSLLTVRYTLIVMLLFSLLVSWGCTTEESPKKVSLYKRGGNTVSQPDKPQPTILRFGFDLKLGPREEVMIYTPFLRYLESATGKRFRIKFTERYEDTVKNLGTGVTDFAAISPLSYVIGAHEYGIKYLVSAVNREGDPRYYSAIFTRPDSSINDLEDLRGKCFAFGSKMSTQGHLIPRKMLEDAGIALGDLGKYLYTASHIDVVKSVLNGECDAGGIQDTLARRLDSEKKIRIIRISEPYPSSLIAYNAAMDSRTVDLVMAALLRFDPAGRHKSMLTDWDKTEMPLGFIRIDELELNRIAVLARKYGLL